MNYSFFLLFLVMMSSQSLFAQEGVWRIEKAQLPNGNAYTGSLNIARSGPSFIVDWKTTAGNYSGLGLIADNKLFVGYALTAPVA